MCPGSRIDTYCVLSPYSAKGWPRGATQSPREIYVGDGETERGSLRGSNSQAGPFPDGCARGQSRLSASVGVIDKHRIVLLIGWTANCALSFVGLAPAVAGVVCEGNSTTLRPLTLLQGLWESDFPSPCTIQGLMRAALQNGVARTCSTGPLNRRVGPTGRFIVGFFVSLVRERHVLECDGSLSAVASPAAAEAMSSALTGDGKFRLCICK